MARRINTVVSAVLIVLLLLHAAEGALWLLGFFRETLLWLLAFPLLLVFLVHTGIGLYLMVKSHALTGKSGADYQQDNHMFWARRDSGIAILLMFIWHFCIFGTAFGHAHVTAAVAVNGILLAASLAWHVLLNLQPLAVALGRPGLDRRRSVIAYAISAVLLVAAIAFIVCWLCGSTLEL